MSLTAAVVLLAGCGSTTSPSVAAANCLRNVLDTDAATSTCQHGRTIDFTQGGESVAKPTNAAGTVTCIRQTGNEFVCQDGHGDQYSVLYDGKRLAYQQTG